MKLNFGGKMNARVLSQWAFWGILFLITLATGCGEKRIYTPAPIPIKPGMVPEENLKRVGPVWIENDQSKDWEKIGKYRHKWDADLKRWAETATIVARKELENRGVEISEIAPKKLILTMDDPELYWDFHKVECTVFLEVETADGYEQTYRETNSTIDLYGSCDGAITRAVTSMFNDPEIVAYLKPLVGDADNDGVADDRDDCPLTPSEVKVDEKGCPLDTDGDGVADYQDHCRDTPMGVTVDYVGCPADSDNDGIPDNLDKCPQTPMGVSVDADGCPVDMDRDGVSDENDHCPETPLGAIVDDTGCWTLGAALFNTNSAEVKPAFYSSLDNIVEVMGKNPELEIEIRGHTDDVGSKAYNQKLSEKRARAVMKYLVDKGIDPNRLSAKGFGYSRPKVEGKTEQARVQNRRVEIKPVTD